MYAGQIVEQGTVEQVLIEPRMPYTMGLIESIPSVEKRGGRLSAITGVVPSPFHLPPNCRFEPRCPYALGPLPQRAAGALRRGRAAGGARAATCTSPSPRRVVTPPIAQHDENLRVGRRLTGAPDRIGNA